MGDPERTSNDEGGDPAKDIRQQNEGGATSSDPAGDGDEATKRPAGGDPALGGDKASDE